MMTFALFRDGVFAETRRLPSRPEDIPHKGVEWFPVGETVTGENVGWAVVDGEAVQTAAPPAPQSTAPQDYPLNKVQFHAMVGILGKKAAIETAIAGIADDTHRAIAEAKYIHSDRFDRDDALFDALAPAVWPELTEAERTATIDAAWMHAKEIA
jgi:hypothetical protein